MAYKVVIFDDEPWSREVVKSLAQWERLGLVLAGEADDGNAGLELLRTVEPNIVITDMRMPGMDGTELLRAIHDRHPDIRIVVMSGYDDFPYIRQALQSRAQDYLLKPVDPDELNRTLEKCIQELQNTADRRPFSMKTPIVFTDRTILDEYVHHRRRTFGFLLELNAPAVRQTLDSLRKVLNAATGISTDRELATRVAHDFLLMLEEFVVRHGAPPDPALFRPQAVDGDDPNLIFDEIGDVFEQAIAVVQAANRQRDHLDLSEVRDHIDNYYQDPLSLQSVARLFLVSKEHLSRAFHKAFGETVNEYISRRRMETARELIANDGMDIKQVAYLSGYQDLAYFYRVFKKQFGVPPGQVRN